AVSVIYQVSGGLLDNVLGSITLSPSGIIAGSLGVSALGLPPIPNAIVVGGALNHPLLPSFDTTKVTSLFGRNGGLGHLKLSDIISGTDKVLDLLESGMKSDIITKIPVIGDGLDLGGTFIGELRRDFVQPLGRLLNGNTAELQVAIQKMIFDELGPG